MKKNVKKRSSHKAVVRITFTAMMVALYFVLDRFLAFFPTDSVKISFSFIAVAVCAIWLGPIEGMLAGGLGDFVSAVLMPVGALNPMLTATSALSGLLFGIACKRRVDAPLSKGRMMVNIVAVNLIVTVVINLGLNTLALALLYSPEAVWPYFFASLPLRAVKEGVMLFIRIAAFSLLALPDGRMGAVVRRLQQG